MGIKQTRFTLTRLYIVIIDSLYQSAICFWATLYLFQAGGFPPEGSFSKLHFGCVLSIYVMTVVNMAFVVTMRSWCKISIVLMFVSTMAIYIYIPIISLFRVTNLYQISGAIFKQPLFWIALPLVVFTALLPKIVSFFAQRMLFPDNIDILTEQEKFKTYQVHSKNNEKIQKSADQQKDKNGIQIAEIDITIDKPNICPPLNSNNDLCEIFLPEIAISLDSSENHVRSTNSGNTQIESSEEIHSTTQTKSIGNMYHLQLPVIPSVESTPHNSISRRPKELPKAEIASEDKYDISMKSSSLIFLDDMKHSKSVTGFAFGKHDQEEEDKLGKWKEREFVETRSETKNSLDWFDIEKSVAATAFPERLFLPLLSCLTVTASCFTMSSDASIAYTVIAVNDDKDQPSLQDLRQQLENGKDEAKIETMKKILSIMASGDLLPQLLMHIIRFVVPSKNKQLKKLLLFYWEFCPKYNPDGKLKQEMILVCNALRNDIQHPNEYIRGMTLRFLCKLREVELLEPLVPAVRSCLVGDELFSVQEHRHAYVRKNAVLALSAIYKNFEHLIPDAPELISQFINGESDQNAKRNAFIMLINSKPSLAVHFLQSFWSQVTGSFDELMQLASIELIRKDCRNPSADKAKYIQCLFALLQASSHTVKYEAANTLVALTSHAGTVKAAASCYIELIIKVSDNNVKLIVLERLNELREKHERVLDDLAMDILRVLSSPDIEVRRKCLDIALEMVSSRNVDEVVGFLKKELVKTHEGEYEKANQLSSI
ncbi:coatomer subunit beta [Nowakowskiella sp. JEL0078]|nr:coatomer subunit beta [Nowakowskiella sp. JEL0078]